MPKNAKQLFTINYIHVDTPKITNFSPNESDVSEIDKKYGYSPFQFEKIQNYNPIYSLFFKTSPTNYNKIALNSKYYIHNYDKVRCVNTGLKEDREIHYKFAPLLDHIKYISGFYGELTDDYIKLPIETENMKENGKLSSTNNMAYTDGFFYYLSSQLLHHHNFVHGIDFYGSYVGIQKLFKFEMWDDIYEAVYRSDFFESNMGKLFHINFDEDFQHSIENLDWSRVKKPKIQIMDNIVESDTSELLSNITSIELCVNTVVSTISELNITNADDITPSNNESMQLILNDYNTELDNSDIELSSDEEDDDNNSELSDTSNTITDSDKESKSINTEGDNNKEEDVEEDDDEANWEECSDDNESDLDTDIEPIEGYINNFPVNVICIEKCEGLLDNLLKYNQMNDDMCMSCMMQIVMSLLVYQKAFHLTHNDLHSRNIMYVSTDVEYIYYIYNEDVFRVPTYGRIFKIIDFGRAIYKYRGKLFCSDSYGPNGEADKQYNTEPFFNPNKKRIDPNYSFDLCRLATSILDLVDKTSMPMFWKTMMRWCQDDMGRNVYMKNNFCEERYPGFKLYMMIARTVHKHTPIAQLKYPEFNQYKFDTSSNPIFDMKIVINVDMVPTYTI